MHVNHMTQVLTGFSFSVCEKSKCFNYHEPLICPLIQYKIIKIQSG